MHTKFKLTTLLVLPALILSSLFSPPIASAQTECGQDPNTLYGQDVWVTKVVLHQDTNKAETTVTTYDGSCVIIDQELLVAVPRILQPSPYLLHDVVTFGVADHIRTQSNWWGFHREESLVEITASDFPIGQLGYNYEVTSWIIQLPYERSSADREVERLYALVGDRKPMPNLLGPLDKARYLLQHWHYAFPQYPLGYDLLCQLAWSQCPDDYGTILLQKYGGELGPGNRTISFSTLPDEAYIDLVLHGYEEEKFVYFSEEGPIEFYDATGIYIPAHFPVIWLRK